MKLFIHCLLKRGRRNITLRLRGVAYYMKLRVVKLGLMEYQLAYDLQLEILKLSQQGAIGSVLLMLEHPPITNS